MNQKYQYLYFLLSVLIKIIYGEQSQVVSEKHLNEIAKLIRDLNDKNSVDSSQESEHLTTHEGHNDIKALLGKYFRDIKQTKDLNVDKDRICKKIGDCPCRSSNDLCKVDDFYEVANEVDQIINDINRSVGKIDGESSSARCPSGKCDSIKNKHMHRQHISSSSSENSDNEIDDDNLLSDDSSKRNVLQALSHSNGCDADDAVNTKLAKAAVTPLTPEDMANFYRPAMEDIRKIILGYIKFRSNFKRVRGLPKTVRGGIQTIREKYRHFKMSDKALSKQIFNILLDDLKKIKIVPNRDPQAQYDVFLPQWMYLEVLKKKQSRRLRSNKRILPLTLHQKIRMQNKQRPRKLLKFVWRRSSGSDRKEYGVPFVLDVQGLGQLT